MVRSAQQWKGETEKEEKHFSLRNCLLDCNFHIKMVGRQGCLSYIKNNILKKEGFFFINQPSQTPLC